MSKEYFETTSRILNGDVKRFVNRISYEAICNHENGLTEDYCKKLERMLRNHIEIEQYEIAEGLKQAIESLRDE
jgi:hypothetical protein